MNRLLSMLILSAFLMHSCVDINENDPQEMEEILVLDGEIEKIDTSPGDRNATIRLTSDLTMNVRFHFPSSIQNAPLILAFHWEGGDDAYASYADCQAIPGLSHTNAIIVAPSLPGGIWWESQSEILILDLLDKMLESWPLDQGKVAITGYSYGGTAAWLYAAVHSDIFSAAIPVAGAYNQEVTFQIPLYVIHSLDDESIPFEGVQNVVNASNNLGSDIKLVLVDGVLHQQGCDYEEYLLDAGTWLLEEVWQ